jgi:hypothetical protein
MKNLGKQVSIALGMRGIRVISDSYQFIQADSNHIKSRLSGLDQQTGQKQRRHTEIIYET